MSSGFGKKFQKVLKVVVAAAAIWYTAGVISEAMAVPPPGSGAKLVADAASGGGFTSTATAYTEAGVSGLEVGATSTELGAVTAETMSLPETVGASMDSVVAGHGALPVTDPTLTASLTPGVEASAADLGANVLGGEKAGTGIVGWAKANPALAVIAGQGAFGAYGAYEEGKDRDAERKAKRERGLGGFAWDGSYKGKTGGGIVESQQQQTVDSTQVQGQSVANVNEKAAPTRPINRKNLPELSKQGLIAQQQVV